MCDRLLSISHFISARNDSHFLRMNSQEVKVHKSYVRRKHCFNDSVKHIQSTLKNMAMVSGQAVQEQTLLLQAQEYAKQIQALCWSPRNKLHDEEYQKLSIIKTQELCVQLMKNFKIPNMPMIPNQAAMPQFPTLLKIPSIPTVSTQSQQPTLDAIPYQENQNKSLKVENQNNSNHATISNNYNSAQIPVLQSEQHHIEN